MPLGVNFNKIVFTISVQCQEYGTVSGPHEIVYVTSVIIKTDLDLF